VTDREELPITAHHEVVPGRLSRWTLPEVRFASRGVSAWLDSAIELSRKGQA
jgi:hypothetical protein